MHTVKGRSGKSGGGGCSMIDFYGEPVQLTFNENSSFSSSCGYCMSFLTIIVFITFLSIQTQKLISLEDPFFSMMTTPRAESEALDLGKLGYNFAVEKIDPRVGRYEVKHTSWSKANGKIKTKVPIMDCFKLFEEEKGLDNLSRSE